MEIFLAMDVKHNKKLSIKEGQGKTPLSTAC